jgi:hypothetical protein
LAVLLTLHPLAMHRSPAPRQAWQIHLVDSLSRMSVLCSKHQLQLACILRRGTTIVAYGRVRTHLVASRIKINLALVCIFARSAAREHFDKVGASR